MCIKRSSRAALFALIGSFCGPSVSCLHSPKQHCSGPRVSQSLMYCVVPFIPTCTPLLSLPALSVFLSRKGFPGDAKQLDATVVWLEELEVTEPDDFIGLGQIRSLPYADSFNDLVWISLQRLEACAMRPGTFVLIRCWISCRALCRCRSISCHFVSHSVRSLGVVRYPQLNTSMCQNASLSMT